jgi:hypothetical protein
MGKLDPAKVKAMIPGIKVTGEPCQRLMNVLVALQASMKSAFKMVPAFTLASASPDGIKWTCDVAANRMGNRVFKDTAEFETKSGIRQFPGVIKNVQGITVTDIPKVGVKLEIELKPEALAA